MGWPRVLVVDDDAFVVGLHAAWFREAGAQVTVAMSVSEARAAIIGGRLDLVVTDFLLPDGAGLDVARLAREWDAQVVIVTGEAWRVPGQEAREAGVSSVVSKWNTSREWARRLLT